MTWDELFNTLVKAVVDLFDTPQGTQLVKDLVAYIESVIAPPPPAQGANQAPKVASNPPSAAADEPRNPSHR